MRRPFSLLCVCLLSCGDDLDDSCGLQSTLTGYTPDCSTAGVTFYAEETRAAVGGVGGYLVLYLPADLIAGEVYGGTSGNPMTALLTLSDGSEELAKARTSTVRVGSVGPAGVELGLRLSLSDGEITGAVHAPVVE